MADIKGLLFDMDGLLLDTEAVGQEAFVEATAPMGIDEATARHAFLYMVGGDAEANHRALNERLSGLDGETVRNAWLVAFEARIVQPVPLRPTVQETLQALAAAGWPMAVVTSSSRAHAEHNLANAGIADFFRGIVPGDEVPRTKPDPAPYLAGAELLGYAPGACAAFEDSDPGITAAMAAGCVATQIPDLRPPERPLPALGQRRAATLAEAARNLGLLNAP